MHERIQPQPRQVPGQWCSLSPLAAEPSRLPTPPRGFTEKEPGRRGGGGFRYDVRCTKYEGKVAGIFWSKTPPKSLGEPAIVGASTTSDEAWVAEGI